MIGRGIAAAYTSPTVSRTGSNTGPLELDVAAASPRALTAIAAPDCHQLQSENPRNPCCQSVRDNATKITIAALTRAHLNQDQSVGREVNATRAGAMGVAIAA